MSQVIVEDEAPRTLEIHQAGGLMTLQLAAVQGVALTLTEGQGAPLEVIEGATLRLEVIEGTQGPKGDPGPASEESMPYAQRADLAGDVIYRGEADPGTAESEPLWRIRRLTIGTDGDVSTEWAGGSADFVNVWADRAALAYQ